MAKTFKIADYVVTQDEDHLRIEWRWFTWTALIWILLGVPILAVTILPNSIESVEPPTPLQIVALLLMPSSIGVGMLVYALILLVTRTRIELTDRQLSVVHPPLFWWKATVPVDAIADFSVESKWIYASNMTLYVFNVQANLLNGRALKLLRGQPVKADAQRARRLLQRRFMQIRQVEWADRRASAGK